MKRPTCVIFCKAQPFCSVPVTDTSSFVDEDFRRDISVALELGLAATTAYGMRLIWGNVISMARITDSKTDRI